MVVVRAAARGTGVLRATSGLAALRACSTELVGSTLGIRVLYQITLEHIELVLA